MCFVLPLKAQNGWHHCSRCKCCLHCLLCWVLLCWRKSHTVGNVGPSHRLLTMVALGNKHKAILCCVCFPWHTHFFAMPLPLLSTLALLPILHVESGSCLWHGAMLCLVHFQPLQCFHWHAPSILHVAAIAALFCPAALLRPCCAVAIS